ncbi:MAG: hypothetical protein HYX75_02065 [Acidobacteria bacterium]|nr:hypothetical protein [Acidobacteriota bacterium]
MASASLGSWTPFADCPSCASPPKEVDLLDSAAPENLPAFLDECRVVRSWNRDVYNHPQDHSDFRFSLYACKTCGTWCQRTQEENCELLGSRTYGHLTRLTPTELKHVLREHGLQAEAERFDGRYPSTAEFRRDLTTPKPSVRKYAVEALTWYIPDVDANALGELASHPDEFVRTGFLGAASNLWVVVAVDEHLPRLAPFLVAGLRHVSRDLRAMAARALPAADLSAGEPAHPRCVDAIATSVVSVHLVVERHGVVLQNHMVRCRHNLAAVLGAVSIN